MKSFYPILSMENQFPLPTPPQAPFGSSKPLPSPEEAAPPPPSYQAPIAAKPPIVKPSPLKIIIPVGLAIAVVAALVFGITKLLSSVPGKEGKVTPGQPVTLTYWGIWEPVTTMKPVIDEFEKQNPGIKISYQQSSPQDYQDRVKTAISSSNPPDIVRLHTTWLPIFVRDLLPSPPNTVSATEINTNFYPIVSKLLVINNQVYGIPLTADSLALYINTAAFQQKSLQPPKVWTDIVDDAKILKEVDPLTGKLIRAGIALGNTSNVDHWPDIVSLMLMQAGVKLTDPQGPAAEETLNFYADFVSKNRVWDDTLPPSTVAFANGKLAMLIAPSWRARDIKQINPSLAWKVIPMPQLPDSDVVNWASIWFEAVPKNSKHPREAWTFLSFLSTAKAQQLLYDAATADRGFPQPPANKALGSMAQENPVVAPFVLGLETAKSFYTAGDTRDSSTGLNARLIKYLEDAVNSLGENQETSKTLETLSAGFKQVLTQFGLVSDTKAVAK